MHLPPKLNLNRLKSSIHSPASDHSDIDSYERKTKIDKDKRQEEKKKQRMYEDWRAHPVVESLRFYKRASIRKPYKLQKSRYQDKIKDAFEMKLDFIDRLNSYNASTKNTLTATRSHVDATRTRNTHQNDYKVKKSTSSRVGNKSISSTGRMKSQSSRVSQTASSMPYSSNPIRVKSPHPKALKSKNYTQVVNSNRSNKTKMLSPFRTL